MHTVVFSFCLLFPCFSVDLMFVLLADFEGGDGLVLANPAEDNSAATKTWSATFGQEFDPLCPVTMAQPSSAAFGSRENPDSTWQASGTQPLAQCANPWNASQTQRISVSGPWVASATSTVGASSSDTPTSTALPGASQGGGLATQNVGFPRLPPPDGARRWSSGERHAGSELASPIVSGARHSDVNQPTSFQWPAAVPAMSAPSVPSRRESSSGPPGQLWGVDGGGGGNVVGEEDARDGEALDHLLDCSTSPMAAQPPALPAAGFQISSTVSDSQETSGLPHVRDELLPGLVQPTAAEPNSSVLPAVLIDTVAPPDDQPAVMSSSPTIPTARQHSRDDSKDFWVLTNEQRTYYEKQFMKLDNGEKLISGESCSLRCCHTFFCHT